MPNAITFQAPTWDKSRITSLTRELAAPGIRGARRGLREALPTGFGPLAERKTAAAITAHGEAIGLVRAGARGAAGVEYGQEYGREFQAKALEFGAERTAALQEERLEWQAGESTAEREFRAGERIGGQEWQEKQGQLLRDWQTAQAEVDRAWKAGEADKEREARVKADQLMKQWQTGERIAGQEWETGERGVEREWRTGEAEVERGWRTGESELERAAREKLQLGMQEWETGERAIGREWETKERISSQEWRAGESGLERDLREKLQAGMQEWQTGERIAGQTWQTAEAQVQRKWGTQERLGGQKWQAAQSQLMKDFQKAEGEIDRAWRVGEAGKARTWQEKADKLMNQWQTQERLAAQKWQETQRLGEQQWRTGERLGAQEWQTGMEMGDWGDQEMTYGERSHYERFPHIPLRKYGGRVEPATMITPKRQLGGPLRKGAPLYMVGEVGPELVKYDSGRSELVGQGGPERRTFPEPGRVIPAGKTKKLLAAPTRRQGGGRVDPGQGMDWQARLNKLMGRYPELRLPKVVQQDIQMIRGSYTNRMNQLLQGIAQTRQRQGSRSIQDLLNPYRGVEALETERDARIQEIMGFWRGRGRQGPAIHTTYREPRYTTTRSRTRERFPQTPQSQGAR